MASTTVNEKHQAQSLVVWMKSHLHQLDVAPAAVAMTTEPLVQWVTCGVLRDVLVCHMDIWIHGHQAVTQKTWLNFSAGLDSENILTSLNNRKLVNTISSVVSGSCVVVVTVVSDS